MKFNKVMVGAMAAASALAVFPAHAVQLAGGSWEQFFWENPPPYDFSTPPPYTTYGGPIYDYYTGDTTFTFTLPTSGRLFITDAFTNGDTFDLTINGVDEGVIMEADTDYAYIDAYVYGWDAAYASPYFSHAVYDLAPGSYTVTGVVPYSPSAAGVGTGALELVPEPAGWALMLVGFGVVGGLVRRRVGRAAIASA